MIATTALSVLVSFVYLNAVSVWKPTRDVRLTRIVLTAEAQQAMRDGYTPLCTLETPSSKLELAFIPGLRNGNLVITRRADIKRAHGKGTHLWATGVDLAPRFEDGFLHVMGEQEIAPGSASTELTLVHDSAIAARGLEFTFPNPGSIPSVLVGYDGGASSLPTSNGVGQISCTMEDGLERR